MLQLEIIIMRTWRTKLIFFFLCFFINNIITLQEATALLQINCDTTTLETGQSYTLRLEVRDVTELWATNLLIKYDPQYIYHWSRIWLTCRDW